MQIPEFKSLLFTVKALFSSYLILKDRVREQGYRCKRGSIKSLEETICRKENAKRDSTRSWKKQDNARENCYWMVSAFKALGKSLKEKLPWERELY
jgi:hypothetical protein